MLYCSILQVACERRHKIPCSFDETFLSMQTCLSEHQRYLRSGLLNIKPVTKHQQDAGHKILGYRVFTAPIGRISPLSWSTTWVNVVFLHTLSILLWRSFNSRLDYKTNYRALSNLLKKDLIVVSYKFITKARPEFGRRICSINKLSPNFVL